MAFGDHAGRHDSTYCSSGGAAFPEDGRQTTQTTSWRSRSSAPKTFVGFRDVDSALSSCARKWYPWTIRHRAHVESHAFWGSPSEIMLPPTLPNESTAVQDWSKQTVRTARTNTSNANWQQNSENVCKPYWLFLHPISPRDLGWPGPIKRAKRCEPTTALLISFVVLLLGVSHFANHTSTSFD